jgi:hypothetical protein
MVLKTFPDAKLLSSPTTDLMEGVPGEKRELILLMATSAHGTPLAQPGGVDLKIGAREQIECKPLAARLQLSHRPISPRPPLPMTATVVLGYAKMGIERRREERLLRHLDRAVHVTVADHRTRAQLLGNELEIAFDILPRQRRGGGHHGGKLSIR